MPPVELGLDLSHSDSTTLHTHTHTQHQGNGPCSPQVHQCPLLAIVLEHSSLDVVDDSPLKLLGGGLLDQPSHVPGVARLGGSLHGLLDFAKKLLLGLECKRGKTRAGEVGSVSSIGQKMAHEREFA